MRERIASQVTSVHNVVMLAGLLGVGLTGSIAMSTAPASDTLAQRIHSGEVQFAAVGIDRSAAGGPSVPAPQAKPTPQPRGDGTFIVQGGSRPYTAAEIEKLRAKGLVQ